MNFELLDFVEETKAAQNASGVGAAFMRFTNAIGAVNAHVFMETGPSGYRASSVPEDLLAEEIERVGMERSHVVDLVREGASRVLWGVDLDRYLLKTTALDDEMHQGRFDHCNQRSSVTFAMPDVDGTYRGAGVGIGFEDRGEQFLRFMDETGGALATAAFVAHSSVQKLLQRERSNSRLSGRQAEILQLLATGHQLGEIADKLGIVDSTVNLHLAQLKKKLNVKTKEQALAIALTDNWIAI